MQTFVSPTMKAEAMRVRDERLDDMYAVLRSNARLNVLYHPLVKMVFSSPHYQAIDILLNRFEKDLSIFHTNAMVWQECCVLMEPLPKETRDRIMKPFPPQEKRMIMSLLSEQDALNNLKKRVDNASKEYKKKLSIAHEYRTKMEEKMALFLSEQPDQEEDLDFVNKVAYSPEELMKKMESMTLGETIHLPDYDEPVTPQK